MAGNSGTDVSKFFRRNMDGNILFGAFLRRNVDGPGLRASRRSIVSENSRPSSLPARVAFCVKDVCDSPPKIPY